jgi:hypothetical protein
MTIRAGLNGHGSQSFGTVTHRERVPPRVTGDG